jgi:electron-transferring-flavoprotein dehydrogenase
LIEKAPELGAHTLSGAVIEISGLAKLFPDWQENCPPVHQKVKVSIYFLTFLLSQ